MAKAASEKPSDSDCFALREDERLCRSYTVPKGQSLTIVGSPYAYEAWSIVKALPGDAQIVGYIMRMVE